MKSIDLHTQKQKKNVQEADLFCWKYIYGVGNKRYWGILLIKYHFVTGFTFIYKQKDTLFLEVYMKMNCSVIQETRPHSILAFFIVSDAVLYVIDMYDGLNCIFALY